MKPEPLQYRRTFPKPRTDWEKIAWTAAAIIFLFMCVLFACLFS